MAQDAACVTGLEKAVVGDAIGTAEQGRGASSRDECKISTATAGPSKTPLWSNVGDNKKCEKARRHQACLLYPLLFLFIQVGQPRFRFQVTTDIKPKSARPVILTKSFKRTVSVERPAPAPAPQIDLARQERLGRQQEKQKQWQAHRQDTGLSALDQAMDYEQIPISITTRYVMVKNKLWCRANTHALYLPATTYRRRVSTDVSSVVAAVQSQLQTSERRCKKLAAAIQQSDNRDEEAGKEKSERAEFESKYFTVHREHALTSEVLDLTPDL